MIDLIFTCPYAAHRMVFYPHCIVGCNILDQVGCFILPTARLSPMVYRRVPYRSSLQAPVENRQNNFHASPIWNHHLIWSGNGSLAFIRLIKVNIFSILGVPSFLSLILLHFFAGASPFLLTEVVFCVFSLLAHARFVVVIWITQTVETNRVPESPTPMWRHQKRFTVCPRCSIIPFGGPRWPLVLLLSLFSFDFRWQLFGFVLTFFIAIVNHDFGATVLEDVLKNLNINRNNLLWLNYSKHQNKTRTQRESNTRP